MTPPGVLSTVQVFPTKKGHGTVGAIPGEDHQLHKGTGAVFL